LATLITSLRFFSTSLLLARPSPSRALRASSIS